MSKLETMYLIALIIFIILSALTLSLCLYAIIAMTFGTKGKRKNNYLNGYEKDFCLHCKKHRTPEGHDGCIGTLKNVMNACCGHGEDKTAYVQFNHKNYNKEPNKIRLKDKDAIDYIRANKLINSNL